MDIIFELLPFIVAIIVFIFRLLAGNKENTPEPQEQGADPATSFDDLLKQIQKQIKEAKQTGNKATKTQEASLNEKRIKWQQEKAIAEAKKVQFVEKGISQEQREQDQHFNPYKIRTATQSKFAKILKDKDQLKNAIILNEILKPKYF